MATARFLQSLGVVIPKENPHFDLEFFMTSTDVGLYNVAKEIFSYLEPSDLNNLRKIGRKNKAMDEFLNNERKFLWERFEKVTLKIEKKKTDQLIGPKGKNLKKLEEIYKVSVWVYPKNPGRFTIVSITGDLQGVMCTVNHIQNSFRDHYYWIVQFDEINSEVLCSLNDRVKEKLQKTTVTIWKEDLVELSITELRKTLQEKFRVAVMIDPDQDYYTITITGSLKEPMRAVDKVIDMMRRKKTLSSIIKGI